MKCKVFMDSLYQQLKKYGRVKINEPLKKHTTFKIGGPARFFVIVKELDKVGELLAWLSEQGEKFFVMGGGSNLLFSDEGYDGVVVKVSTEGLTVDGEILTADAGVLLSQAVVLATGSELSGLEWAVGIPGTVGGAIYGNAGAMGESMSNIVEEATAWLDGEVVELNNEECRFSYRSSLFKEEKVIVLQVKLRLHNSDKKSITKKINEYIAMRQKYSALPSPGSFFKNIQLADYPGDKKDLPPLFLERGSVPAGWLIDECGLRGFRIGDAGVSEEHGNFVVNYGAATQAQVLELIEEIAKKVYNKFKVELIPEVQIIKN